MNKIQAKNRKEWRQWLSNNHQTENEIWLVYYKKHSKKASISYSDSVEEALCFGWIDGIKKRIDDEKYMHRFTPRTKSSHWSKKNIETAERLIAEGLMTKTGLKFFESGKNNPVKSFEPGQKDIEIIENEIRRNNTAWDFYEQLAPSYKKHYQMWIISAKRQETKERRLAECINRLEKKMKPGMV